MNVYAQEKTNRLIGSWEVPATWFQSANSMYILIFATVVGSFWAWWGRKGRETSSLFKMAVGIIITGFGFLFMVGAVRQYEVEGASAMYWLMLAYMFHTLGELCLSPVALSFVTKVSPQRYVAFMMGAYFAATGLGNKVAGSLGELSTELGEYAIFLGITVFCVLFGILMVAITKPLKRLAHGAEDLQTAVVGDNEGYEVEEPLHIEGDSTTVSYDELKENKRS